MTKFNDRLRENIDEWFSIRVTMTAGDYNMLKSFAHKTENK